MGAHKVYMALYIRCIRLCIRCIKVYIRCIQSVRILPPLQNMSQGKSNQGQWRSLKKMLRRRRRNVLWQMPGYQKFFIACGDSLQASSPGRSGGGMGKWRRACNYVSGNWIPPPIPLWHPVDWADRFPPISANVKKHSKTRERRKWRHF